MKKQLNLYQISDCTGETLNYIAKSLRDRFGNVEITDHIYSLMRSTKQIDKMIAVIKKQPGIVMYTIVDDELRAHLKQKCLQYKIEFIPVLSPMIMKICNYLDIKIDSLEGRKLELDQDYYKRINAINYALNHDDGQNYQNLEEADIILVGVSRTSKSPTSIYLANRGYKTANIPYITNSPINEELLKLNNSLIIGLTLSSERLIDIRKNRLLSLKEHHQTSYIDIEEVTGEVTEAKKFFTANNWQIIDVTKRSVEETAAKILHIYHRKFDHINSHE